MTVISEEVNRLVTDSLSTLLFCPTQTAVDNLKREGIINGVYHVGDVMQDAINYNIDKAEHHSNIINNLKLNRNEYIAMTIHRPFNTDYPERLSNILHGIEATNKQFVFPIHPRTKKCIEKYNLNIPSNVIVTSPLGYLDMLQLMVNAERIVTDSGGVQKEAYMVKKPCVTLRENTTEWKETLEGNWNIIVSPSKASNVIQALNEERHTSSWRAVFGDGNGSQQIVNRL